MNKWFHIKSFCVLITVCFFGIKTVVATTYIWSDTTTVTNSVALDAGDILQLSGGGDDVITVGGDVEITVTGNAFMEIGTSAGSGALSVQPEDNQDAHVIFNVAVGKILEVKVWNDLFFTGNDVGEKPMYVSFRGKGKTKFRLPSGQILSFGGTSTVGTHVRVLMDLGSTETGNKQVVFEKWSYSGDDTDTDLTKHTYVKIGQNSSFIYVSQHKVGVDGGESYGYGSVGFDPSNSKSGRLILDIAKGVSAGDFKDGAFNIYGSFVGVADQVVTNTDLRSSVVPRYRAGLGALFYITDDVARAANSESLAAHIADAANQRGLVVINRNQSLPRLANNYDQMTTATDSQYYSSVLTLTNSRWFVANTYQTGFVLGNNGVIDIEHNRFIDYVAGTKNTTISDGVHTQPGATLTDADTHHESMVKKHNPSALIVDGHVFSANNTANADTDYAYLGTDVAQIKLRGRAGIFARVGASSNNGELLNETVGVDGILSSSTTESYLACVINKAVYKDGYLAGDTPHVSSEPEGEHAIDFEGTAKISSFVNQDGQIKAGYINIPTVLIDHAGRELKLSNGTISLAGDRPLSTSTSVNYFRYNTSSILINNDIELHDVTFINNDVSRNLSSLPVATNSAAPIIVCGELPALEISKALADDPTVQVIDYTGAAIYLYNSTIACHESMVSAGVHWVVHEIVGTETWSDGNNISKIIFYNRGNELDLDISGYGRVFQLGSRANVMADGSTQDIFTIDGVKQKSLLRDSFIDVYRKEASADLAIGANKNTIKLSLQSASEAGVSTSDKAIHVVYLANRSNVNLGWPVGQYDSAVSGSTEVEADRRYEPWAFSEVVLAASVSEDDMNANKNRFNPFSQGVGELEVAGDNIYFGAGGRYDATGTLNPAANELPPRRGADSGGIIYANFGGKLGVAGNYNMFLNTVIARRYSRVAGASGILALNFDQFLMLANGKVQTVGFDKQNDTVPEVLGNNTSPMVYVYVPDLPKPVTMIKGVPFTRTTESVSAPVSLPLSGMLTLKTGDVVEQMQVAGATRAAPLHLHVSGDSSGLARVREFVTVDSDPSVLGEGAHAAIFLDGGARIGLGTRQRNKYSLRAWNLLGEDRVSLFFNGNATIDINSDLLITDKLPFVATSNFGSGSAHQITFFSSVPREIRIPRNGVLDLGSFGQGDAYAQRISFAGKVRLVLEPGAKILFPSLTEENESKGPVLYFNDESELIFLEENDPDASRWVDGLTGSDKVRQKIMGVGQIWLNKKAKVKIMSDSFVGIEADEDTRRTNVTFSLRRQSSLLLGDETTAGGALQIGNIVSGGGDGTFTGTVEVNFTLKVNGPGVQCHINREGFLGLGAGVVNKWGNPNGDVGDEQNTAWRLQALKDVKNISLEITSGLFDHNNIFDGWDSQSSLIAIGPLSPVLGGKYTFSMGAENRSYFRGGGNLLFVGAEATHDSPFIVGIESAAVALTGSDSGKYTLCAPSESVRMCTSISGATITTSSSSYVFMSSAVTDEISQGVAMRQFFTLLSMSDYATDASGYIAAGKDQFATRAGYINGTTIKRKEVSYAINSQGYRIDADSAQKKGYFRGVGVSSTGEPASFMVP